MINRKIIFLFLFNSFICFAGLPDSKIYTGITIKLKNQDDVNFFWQRNQLFSDSTYSMITSHFENYYVVYLFDNLLSAEDVYEILNKLESKLPKTFKFDYILIDNVEW